MRGWEWEGVGGEGKLGSRMPCSAAKKRKKNHSPCSFAGLVLRQALTKYRALRMSSSASSFPRDVAAEQDPMGTSWERPPPPHPLP